MNFPTKLVRALAPVALVAIAVPSAAAESPDLALVRAHITSVDTMTANFVQTDSKGRSAAGTLQMKRPGRIRFQYGSGDLLLVADGQRLTLIDYQVGQKSSWTLSKTPLGVLLSGSPDLKGVKVVDSKNPKVVAVRASSGMYGTLILAFMRSSSAPGGLQLYGWTAIDGQNRRTTVKLTNVRYNVPVPASAFTYPEPKKKK